MEQDQVIPLFFHTLCKMFHQVPSPTPISVIWKSLDGTCSQNNEEERNITQGNKFHCRIQNYTLEKHILHQVIQIIHFFCGTPP